jgi:hypothetical protein
MSLTPLFKANRLNWPREKARPTRPNIDVTTVTGSALLRNPRKAPQNAVKRTESSNLTLKSSKNNDLLAVQAVSSEPVSAVVSLIGRENTGNFAISSPYLALRHPTTHWHS